MNYSIKTKTIKDGNVLFFNHTIPTRNLKFTLNYSNTNIKEIDAFAFFVSKRNPKISKQADTQTITVELSNEWAFPRSGLTFVWTLK